MNLTLTYRRLLYRVKMRARRIDSYVLGEIKVRIYKTDDPEIILVRSEGPKKYDNEFEVPLDLFRKNKELINRRIINGIKSKFDYHMFG